MKTKDEMEKKVAIQSAVKDWTEMVRFAETQLMDEKPSNYEMRNGTVSQLEYMGNACPLCLNCACDDYVFSETYQSDCPTCSVNNCDGCSMTQNSGCVLRQTGIYNATTWREWLFASNCFLQLLKNACRN